MRKKNSNDDQRIINFIFSIAIRSIKESENITYGTYLSVTFPVILLIIINKFRYYVYWRNAVRIQDLLVLAPLCELIMWLTNSTSVVMVYEKPKTKLHLNVFYDFIMVLFLVKFPCDYSIHFHIEC